MNVCDFSALLQLCAGLSIALVAVEYSKTYTYILSKKVFKFGDIIKQSFKNIEDSISGDLETLSHIEPVLIDGKSTSNQIEKVRRNYEKLQDRIPETMKHLKNEAYNECESKSFSALSLWSFLYCVIALFLSGIIMPNFVDHIKLIWCFLTVFTSLYFIIGWLKGEKKEQWKLCDFSGLSHTILWFSFIFIFSCFLGIIMKNWVEESVNLEIRHVIWILLLIISVLLGYTNFIVFFIKIRTKASYIRKVIDQKTSEIQNEYNILKVEVDSLTKVNEVKSKLFVEKN